MDLLTQTLDESLEWQSKLRTLNEDPLSPILAAMSARLSVSIWRKLRVQYPELHSPMTTMDNNIKNSTSKTFLKTNTDKTDNRDSRDEEEESSANPVATQNTNNFNQTKTHNTKTEVPSRETNLPNRKNASRSKVKNSSQSSSSTQSNNSFDNLDSPILNPLALLSKDFLDKLTDNAPQLAIQSNSPLGSWLLDHQPKLAEYYKNRHNSESINQSPVNTSDQPGFPNPQEKQSKQGLAGLATSTNNHSQSKTKTQTTQINGSQSDSRSTETGFQEDLALEFDPLWLPETELELVKKLTSDPVILSQLLETLSNCAAAAATLSVWTLFQHVIFPKKMTSYLTQINQSSSKLTHKDAIATNIHVAMTHTNRIIYKLQKTLLTQPQLSTLRYVERQPIPIRSAHSTILTHALLYATNAIRSISGKSFIAPVESEGSMNRNNTTSLNAHNDETLMHVSHIHDSIKRSLTSTRQKRPAATYLQAPRPIDHGFSSTQQYHPNSASSSGTTVAALLNTLNVPKIVSSKTSGVPQTGTVLTSTKQNLDGNDYSKLDPRVTSPHTTSNQQDRQSCDLEDGHLDVKPGILMGNPPKFRVISLIGEGTFGKVADCLETLSTKRYAIKIIRNIPKYRQAAKNELEVLNQLKLYDPEGKNHCVQLHSYFEHRNHICMVFPKLGLSLFDFMKLNDYHPYSLAHLRLFAKQILTSVRYMHELSLIHTDLKPENILFVNSEYEVKPSKSCPKGRNIPKWLDIKTIDFGSTVFGHRTHNSIVTTRHYRAPEVILRLGWSYPADIWSIGCILVELYCGEPLFQTHDNVEHLAMMEQVLGTLPFENFVSRVRGNESKWFSSHGKLLYPQLAPDSESYKHVTTLKPLSKIIFEKHFQFYDLLCGMLTYYPSRRYTADQCLSHAFFHDS